MYRNRRRRRRPLDAVVGLAWVAAAVWIASNPENLQFVGGVVAEGVLAVSAPLADSLTASIQEAIAELLAPAP